MKNQIFTALVFLGFLTNTLQAQENAGPGKIKTKNNINSELVYEVRVIGSENGCDILFDLKRKDISTNQGARKRMYKPFYFIVSALDNSISEVTGMGNNVSVQVTDRKKALAAASIKTGTISAKWIMSGADKKELFKSFPVENGAFILPTACDDGDYDMSVSWNWGQSNAGSKACTANFIVTMQGGICTAINERGTSARTFK